MFGLSQTEIEMINDKTTLANLADNLLLKVTEMKKLRIGVPSPDEVNEGNMVLSFVPAQGLYLFTKYNNNLHHIKFTEGAPQT